MGQIKCKNSANEIVYLNWSDILAQTKRCIFDNSIYTLNTPVGAEWLLIEGDSIKIEVSDLRLLIDNLRNGGVSLDFKQIKVVPSRYLNDLQGYNSIVLYRGWFCRVDSCGGVILCSEQEAYDRGLLAK